MLRQERLRAAYWASPVIGPKPIRQLFTILQLMILSATPLNLLSGEHAQAQFSIPLIAAFKLSGTVSGIAGYKQVSRPMLADATDRPLFSANRWDSQTG